MIHAESDGVVLAAPYVKGEKISSEKAAVELGNFKEMILALEVESADINEITEGKAASIIVDIYPEYTLKGKVLSRCLVANEGKYTVKGWD